MENNEVVLEPIDFNKIRQKGRNHRRTQSNTAFDLCGILKTHQSKPELINDIVETYNIMDGNDTKKLVDAINDKENEKQIIVEDIYEIPTSRAIVPHQSSSCNPMNFVKKRNLSCGGSLSNTCPIRAIDLRADPETLNDIIGLNVILERKNSVESSEFEAGSLSSYGHSRTSSSSAMEPKLTHNQILIKQDSRLGLTDRSNLVHQQSGSSLVNTKGSSQDIIHINADLQVFLPVNDNERELSKNIEAELQKRKSTPHKPVTLPNAHMRTYTAEKFAEPVPHDKEYKEKKSDHFHFDSWKKPIAYVRDRSTSKSVTPTNLTSTGPASSSQTPAIFLNKSATQNTSSAKTIVNPLNIPKKVSPSSAKNFLKVLGKTHKAVSQQLRGMITLDSVKTEESQNIKIHKSFLELERSQTESRKARTPLSNKTDDDLVQQLCENNKALETKIFSLESKIDSLLEKNVGLEEHVRSLVGIIGQLSVQFAELQEV